jgi:iron complex outermembrane recepter protein
VSSGGNQYSVGASDFTMSNEQLQHYMHALSLKTNTKGVFDWEVALSQYRYARDDNRAPSHYAAGVANGAGTLTDGRGTGWNALAAKGTYRPDGLKGAHLVDFGLQRDAYKLSQIKSNLASGWTGADAGSLSTDIGGNTQLQSLWAQDTWRVTKDWKTVWGLRSEYWRADNGHTTVTGVVNPLSPYAARTESALSPKAALSFQLYGSTSTATSTYVNDANLKPEKSVTSEWSVETDLAYKNGGSATLRGTVFLEDTRNSLYSQTSFEPLAKAGAGDNVTRVSNIGRIKTQGVEVSYQGVDVFTRGLDLSGSLTYAESKITENAGFVVTAGDTIGRYQPRVPLTRATALAGYRWSEKLSTSLGARYSGKQYLSLNNLDVNGFAYQGASKFFVVDTRLRYQFDKTTSMAMGIDNLNNYTYWNFHPYPQRTYHAELRVDWK